MFSESAYFSSAAMVLALVTLWEFEGEGKDYVSKFFSWQLFTANVTGLSTSVLTRVMQPYTIMKFLLTLDAKFKLSTKLHDKIHDCRGEVVTHDIEG